MAEPVAILGGGAIGQLLSALLVQRGIETVIIGRQGSGHEVREHQLTSQDGQVIRHRVRHMAPESMEPCQALLITTKAYQAEQAVAPLLPQLPAQTPIVLLHNGMGPQQKLAQRFPERNWWAGTLTDGALKEGQWTVRHTGLGQRFVGPMGSVAPLPSSLAAIDFEQDDNILIRLWQKLAVNALINPLTALHRCPNGALTRPEFLSTLTQLSEELARVATSQGVTLNAELVLTQGLTVAKATSGNRSSMLTDVEAGRPTEIEAISGYLVALAEQADIAVPAHRSNLEQVRALHNKLKT